ncbi:cell wall protein [Fusarium pseudocircinatum]|uniref:Cell wall protein n=1 Tax=Fusarium pseudocircinatum TaxID=56676 RepID=A0A8H5PUE1_9HYPO|nr:cell wall protein [Fusarium pseudocircinatum]
MRFTTQVLSLSQLAGFLSLALASPSGVIRDPPSLVQRDLATITGVLNDVGSGIDDLDSAVKAFKGDSDPVVDAAESLVSVINDGKTKVDKSDDLSLSDALGLQDPVKDLTKQAETLTDDLKAKKPQLQEAGLCGTTRAQISNINDASKKLIASVVSKVPEAAQGIAEDLASGLTDVLNDAQDAFSEKNCVDKKGSSTSKQVASTTEPAAGTTEAGSLPSTADKPTVSATESASQASSTAAASVTDNTDKPYPPIVSTTAGEAEISTPTPPIVTAGAAIVVPAGAIVLGMAALLI